MSLLWRGLLDHSVSSGLWPCHLTFFPSHLPGVFLVSYMSSSKHKLHESWGLWLILCPQLLERCLIHSKCWKPLLSTFPSPLTQKECLRLSWGVHLSSVGTEEPWQESLFLQFTFVQVLEVVRRAHQGSAWPRRIRTFSKEGNMRRVTVKSKLVAFHFLQSLTLRWADKPTEGPCPPSRSHSGLAAEQALEPQARPLPAWCAVLWCERFI